MGWKGCGLVYLLSVCRSSVERRRVGASAWVILNAAEPCYPYARFDDTALKAAAVSSNRIANPSQTTAAEIIDPAPAPQYIRPESISRGSTAKSIANSLMSRRSEQVWRHPIDQYRSMPAPPTPVCARLCSIP